MAEDWNINQVVEFVASQVGSNIYERLLRENDIDGPILLKLDTPNKWEAYCTGLQESHRTVLSAAVNDMKAVATPGGQYNVPKVVGSFQDLEMVERVGQGLTADVWRATWGSMGTVGVKLLRLADQSDDTYKSFRQEVEVLRHLQHPRVLGLLSVCFDPPSLIMPFMDGGSLYDFLHSHKFKLTLTESVRMALDIAQGMQFLHANRMIHRDLKSKNVLLDHHLRPVICDFGLTRIRDQAQSLVSGTQGTPAWMAPEALQGEAISAAADVYSFGVVLWEMITGRIPWKELASFQIAGAVGFSGKRLKIPEGTDDALQTLMTECFAAQDARPTFDDIIPRLTAIIKKHRSEDGDPPIPQAYLCPITMQVMQDPVVAADYYTYERCNVLHWLESKSTSPINGQELEHTEVVANDALRETIDAYCISAMAERLAAK